MFECLWPKVGVDGLGPSVGSMQEHGVGTFGDVANAPLCHPVLVMGSDATEGDGLPCLANVIHEGTIRKVIQFPPEMDENWVRYGLAKLGQISRLPNWQRMLFCAYTTQLLHSTGEGCWNYKDSYFIWFEFVC